MASCCTCAGRARHWLDQQAFKAHELQDQGLDTVEANLKLGFPADLRKFDIAGQMLEHLGVKSVNLMTNNPDKIAAQGVWH